MSFKSTRRKSAFTLIELLVVIAIIALLLSIVLPALRKVKMQAKIVICGSNQKQLVYALLAYSENNDSAFPYHPTMDNEANNGEGKVRHRPFELNWDHNNMALIPKATVESRTMNDYPYVGRFLYPYMEDAGGLNCKVSEIGNDTPWPPEESGLSAVGTYGDFYENGTYASLHSTYMLLWRYRIPNPSGASGFSSFEGPRKTNKSSQSTLLVQDSLFYTTTNQNMLWGSPQTSWFSSHWYKSADSTGPYFTIKDTTVSPNDGASMVPPKNLKLNSGYADGHVDRFSAEDTRRVFNINVRILLNQKYR